MIPPREWPRYNLLAISYHFFSASCKTPAWGNSVVTQIRHHASEGRTCFDRKIAVGKRWKRRGGKEAVLSLKRRISDAIFARLQAHRVARSVDGGSGGQKGNDSVASAAGSHPEHRLFGEATPEPAITLNHPVSPKRGKAASTSPKKIRKAS
jgi:hypothetical protein